MSKGDSNRKFGVSFSETFIVASKIKLNLYA